MTTTERAPARAVAGEPPRVTIWIRATLDWSDPAVVDRIDPAFLPKLEVWNDTFSLTYQAFRAELRRIASLNLSRVTGAAVREPDDWDAIPDGSLVVPVDDDDWFDPELVTALHAVHDPGAIAYRWTSTFLEIPTTFGHHVHLVRRALIPGTPPKQFCTTNNYALVKGPGTRRLAEGHMQAGEALHADERVVQLDRRLSLMNRTLGSQTTIGHRNPGVTRGHLLRKHRRYRGLYERAPRRLPAWSHEYIALTAELMRRLHPTSQGR